MALFSTIGSIIQGNAAERAAETQARATTDATNRALDFTEEGRDLAFDFMTPYYDTGLSGMEAYSSAILAPEDNVFTQGGELTANGLGGALTSMGINRAGMDFRLNEGLSTLGNQFSAMGGLDGNQAKALERFRMGTVTDEYDRGLARLQGLAGVGQQAAGGLAAAATGSGGNMGQTALAGGSAAAQAQGAAQLNSPGAAAFRGLGQGVQALLGSTF